MRVLPLSTTIFDMAQNVDPDDLIDAAEVAPIIGLNNPKGVSVYSDRYEDFPNPAVAKGRCVLWVRSDIEKWAADRAR